jgi:hypothetical protein
MSNKISFSKTATGNEILVAVSIYDIVLWFKAIEPVLYVLRLTISG